MPPAELSSLIAHSLTDFCLENPQVLPAWRPYSRWDRKVHHHDKDAARLVELGYKLHPLYGTCFNVAGTLHYMLGGKTHGSVLMKTRRVHLVDNISTTHWLVSKDGTHFDPTKEQFETFGVDIESHYGKAVPAYMGRPYFKRDSKWYDENVPTKAMTSIARAFKEKHGTAYGLDWWIEEEECERPPRK